MEKEYVFVSLMGTQIMGTLQPFMALCKEYGMLKARILYTEGRDSTKPQAEAFKRFVEEKKLGSCELTAVGYQTSGENALAVKVEKIAVMCAESSQRICFNVEGGLNYLLPGCVMAVLPYKPELILAMEHRILLYDTETKKFRVLSQPEMLSIADILKLQGVDYSLEKRKEKSELQKLVDKGKIKGPENSLANVSISGIIFDYIWNLPNNRLAIIKDWTAYENDPVKLLAEQRAFSAWSKDRKKCSQVFDKKVFALVRNRQSEERMLSGSQDKIEILDYGNIYHPEKGLERIFHQKNPRPRKGELKPGDYEKLPLLKDNTLVVSIGTTLENTLNVIATHKPKHLLLCYTPKKEPVDKYAHNIAKFASELGIESVTLAKITLEGEFMDEILPEAEQGARVAVNITPGTKPQTAMFTLWARKRGFAIYSMNRNIGLATLLLGEGEDIPIKVCPPLFYFQVRESRLGSGIQKLNELEEEWMEPLCRFMLAADKAGLGDKLFDYTCKEVKLGADSLKLCGSSKWRLVQDGRTWEFSTKKGSGFEKLCAYALAREGGSDVILNFKELWSEENGLEESKIGQIRKSSDGGEKHKLELDVVGCYGSDYILISCKSNPYKVKKEGGEYTQEERDEILNAAGKEAKNTAANLGRFAHAVLAHRSVIGNKEPESAVMVDWRVICEPGALKEVIDKLCEDKSQTR